MTLLAALLLLGCGNTLPRVTLEPPSNEDATMIALTIEAWAQHGFPRPDAERVREDVRVTDAADLATFHRLCHVCAPSAVDPDCEIHVGGWRVEATGERVVLRASGCSASFDRTSGPAGMFSPGDQWRLLVVAPGQWSLDQREAIVVHEAVHQIGSLAGSGTDSAHADPRRWCAGTCASGNVEGDSREAVRQTRALGWSRGGG